MCTDGISHLVFRDPTIQEMMSNPALDLIHKQVVMLLYSLDAEKRLDQFKEFLPTYLGKDWSECLLILEILSGAGFLKRTGEEIRLTYPIVADDGGFGCGCH